MSLRSDRETVKALADRYFAEQCARLGPIAGVAAPVRARRSDSANPRKAASRAAARQPVRAAKIGAHGSRETIGGMLDRLRL